MSINSLQKELNKLQEDKDKNSQVLTNNALLMLGGLSFLGIFGVARSFLPYYDKETINNFINTALIASTGAEVYLGIRLKRLINQYYKIKKDIYDKKKEINREREETRTNFTKVVEWVSAVVDREDTPRYGEDYLKQYDSSDSGEKTPVLTKKTFSN